MAFAPVVYQYVNHRNIYLAPEIKRAGLRSKCLLPAVDCGRTVDLRCCRGARRRYGLSSFVRKCQHHQLSLRLACLPGEAILKGSAP